MRINCIKLSYTFLIKAFWLPDVLSFRLYIYFFFNEEDIEPYKMDPLVGLFFFFTRVRNIRQLLRLTTQSYVKVSVI